jgi:GNAT superfamily N-acetyltransferase
MKGGCAVQNFVVRPLTGDDRPWVDRLMRQRWGGETVVTRGVVHWPAELPGFVALRGGERVGLVTCSVRGKDCEIVSLDSLAEGTGVGTSLIEAAREWARQRGCERLWLVTTNDNVGALRFYQKRGFVLVALHQDAVERSRRLKPGIPLVGNDGIPIRDEIELEISLEGKWQDRP